MDIENIKEKLVLMPKQNDRINFIIDLYDSNKIVIEPLMFKEIIKKTEINGFCSNFCKHGFEVQSNVLFYLKKMFKKNTFNYNIKYINDFYFLRDSGLFDKVVNKNDKYDIKYLRFNKVCIAKLYIHYFLNL